MIELLIVLLSIWNPAIERYAAEFDVNPDIVRALIFVESNGDPYAEGYSGEKGLMQIMVPTAQYIENSTDMIAEQILNDPEINIRAGTWYFALWYHRFVREGREKPLEKALAAYNGGPKHVIDCDCVPSFTQHYVDKVKGVLGIKYESIICADNSGRCLVEDM